MVLFDMIHCNFYINKFNLMLFDYVFFFLNNAV